MQTMIDAFIANRKWSKILSVLMIILFVMSILGEFGSVLSSSIVNSNVNMTRLSVKLFTNTFFYVIPAIALWNYAKEVKKAEDSSDPISHLEDACEQQAKYFKVLGITTLVLTVIVVIGIGAALILPMYASYVG